MQTLKFFSIFFIALLVVPLVSITDVKAALCPFFYSIYET